MKHSLMIATATVLLLVGHGCASRSPSTGSTTRDSVSAHASEVAEPVLLPVPDDPTITFKVWFRAGSADDPAGKEGLAYLTGQLIAEGSTTNHRYEEILEALYPLASGYGVRVDREMTVLSGRTHRDNLKAFFGLLTDAYLRPAFSADDFERLRTDQLNFLRNTLRFASDEELGKAAFHGLVFEGQSYAHPPQGTVAGLESLTVDDARDFYRKFYCGANAVVALGGGFDDALLGRFQATVDALPKGPAPARDIAPAPEFDGRHVVLVDKPDADSSISFGFPIEVRRGEREFYALWVANSWLGEHRNSSSHLYKVIREQRGMNYGDYAYIEAFPQGGRRSFPPTHVGRTRQNFEVWIRTLPDEQAHFALRAAMRELQELVARGMSREDFELTVEFLRKYLLHYADTTAARLGYAVDDRFYGIDGAGHLARFGEVLEEITLEEVNQAIKKHLRLDAIKFAIVTGNAAELATALAADAESPMSYESEKPAQVLEADREIASLPLQIEREQIRIIPVSEMFAR